MRKTNVLLLLTPKVSLACLDESMSIRQAYEKMKAHRYMALPLISMKGEYTGTITEGDILHYMVDKSKKIEELAGVNVRTILRVNYTPAVKVDADLSTILETIMGQNFVPVVDDRNILMGIVTRKAVLKELTKDEE